MKYMNGNGNGGYIEPNEAQVNTLESIDRSKNNGKNRYLIVLPSGIGKTYLSAFETKGFNGRVLYLVHRNEILDQAINVFKNVHGLADDDIGQFNHYVKDLDKNIVFATIQTISKWKSLKKIKRNYFDYVILDEYHHVGADTYKRVMNYFKPKYFLGMTATPFRFDGKDILKQVEGNVAYNMGLRDGIDSGLLVPFVYYGLWDDVDYSDIEHNSHRYKEKDLDKKLLINKRDDAVLKKFKKKLKGKQTIGFCCSVKHVERSVVKFNKAGIKSIGISYKISVMARRKIIEDFRNGRYQVVFTRDIFNEGVDFPEVEGLLFLRPTFSKTIFLQQLGRGLRTRKGKKNVIVLDFIGNYVNAYKIKSWLHEIVGKGGEREIKPVYNHRVSRVMFDEKVIDLFEYQESRILTKDKLIDNYFNVKKRLNRQPRVKDMDVDGDYSSGSYANYFGTWNNFLKVVKEDILLYSPKDVKKNDLIDNYFELKKKLKRQPKMKDMRRRIGSEYDLKVYYRLYESWNHFLKSIGEPILMHTKNVMYDEKKLIIEYHAMKKRLGRIPTAHELRREPYALVFGSWIKFLEKVGDIGRELNIPNSRLIEDFERVHKKLKRVPSSTEYNNLGRYSHVTLISRWENWNGVIKAMGYKPVISKNTKICVNCKKEYVEYASVRSKFCSMKCRDDIRKVTKICPVCKKGFLVGKSSVDRRTTCSMKCYSNYRKK